MFLSDCSAKISKLTETSQEKGGEAFNMVASDSVVERHSARTIDVSKIER